MSSTVFTTKRQRTSVTAADRASRTGDQLEPIDATRHEQSGSEESESANKKMKLDHTRSSSSNISAISSTSGNSLSNLAIPTTPSSAGSSISTTPASGSDMRSILKSAALARAARSRTQSSTTPPAVIPSPSAKSDTTSPTSQNGEQLATAHKPPHLHLRIGSPLSGSPDVTIGTPVIYAGPTNTPTPIPSSLNLAPSPVGNELAGFGQAIYQLPLPAYTSPSNSAAAASSSITAGVSCPLCSQLFSPSMIEHHAATCTGEQVSDVSMTPISDTNSRRPPRPPTAPESDLPKFSTHCSSPTKPLPFFPREHDTIKVLTWNCWFDELCMKQRMEAIGSVIQAESPHVVALQEVTEASLSMIQRSDWFKEYYVTDRTQAPYFTLLCTKFAPINPRRLPFQSEMARDLLCMNIAVPTSRGIRQLTIATSHLESEYRRKESRRQQLETALKLLSQNKQQTSTAIYCGDMNLVGPEALDIVAKYGWVDGWLTLNPQRGGDKAGVTFDTRLNAMLAAQPRTAKNPYQVRFDRFWLRLGASEQATTEQKSGKDVAAAGSVTSSMARSPPPATTSFKSDWRLTSIDRIGLCPIDLTQPKLYGKTNYKSFASSPTPSTTTSTSSTATAPTSTGPRIHGIFNLAANTTSTSPTPASPSSSAAVILPSDHFGLVMTMELNKD